MRYRIRVITLMAIAVDKVLKMWRQEAEKRVKKAARQTLQAAG